MKRTIPFLLIIGAVFAVYAPTLQNGFVWDDTALILRDPLIRSWRLIPEGFNHYLFVDATASDFYRPVQRLLYTGLYCGFAFNAVPYHLASILCHALAAAMLFVFVRALLRDRATRKAGAAATVPLIAAAVWAIHPVQTAAVAYAAGIADPLAAMFGFAACYCVLRSSNKTSTTTLLWIVLGSLGFLLSGLSKENGFIFIAIAAAVLAARKSWNVLWKLAIGVLFVATIYGVLRCSAEHDPSPAPRDPAPLTERPLMMSRAVAEYAGLLILPTHLHMDRELDGNRGEGEGRLRAASWRELQTVLGLVVIAAAVFWFVRARRRSPSEFLLLLLALIAYVPVSGIWQLNASVAEHWLYVPSAFLFVAAAVAVAGLTRRDSPVLLGRHALGVAVAAWCLFLGIRTFVRTFDWHDQRTFLERTIAAGGDSARMLINLGGLELSENHLDKAKAALQSALKKEPDQPIAVVNLGAVALKQNDFATARTLLTRATQMPVVDGRAHELLAVLENKERGQANLMRMRLASRTGAADWSIEKRYIRLLDEAGSTVGAIQEVEHCLATEWYRAESWLLLSQLLKKAGQPDKAADAFQLAQQYDIHLVDHAL